VVNKKSAAWAATLSMLAVGVAPAALAGTAEKVLYTFASGYANEPTGGVVKDAAGNLYGSTEFGGNAGEGVIFQLSPNGKGGWTYHPILTFNGNNGAFPQGRLTFDSQGNIYGTTIGFGGMGDVFELSPGQNGWTITKTYQFTGQADGFDANAGVTLDAAGNVYGATMESYDYNGYGSIWKLTPSGNGWQETTIHQFTYGTDGGYPHTELTLDRKGNVYGSVQYGGTNGTGYVFKFHPVKSGWQETVLHNFGDGDAGGSSYGDLILDKAGNLYGTTGLYDSALALWTGSIFELTKPSQDTLKTQQTWPVTTLYQFTSDAGGGMPINLTFDNKGNIFGPSEQGGTNDAGLIYELARSVNNGQTVWTESTLYSFAGGNDGCEPFPSVIFDNTESKRVYGAAAGCGANNNGVIFDVKK
jgi:uncharacterized repeat protein (TIGR03803 family)